MRLRVKMMNSRCSGTAAGWRYVLWSLLISAMVLVCRYKQLSDDVVSSNSSRFSLPMTNDTRALVAKLENNQPWFRTSSLINREETGHDANWRFGRLTLFNYPDILCLRNNHLAWKLPYGQSAKLFIDGRESPTQQLAALRFDNVVELYIYQKVTDMPAAKRFADAYQVLITTTASALPSDTLRTHWRQFLQANAITDYALGTSSTFSMNDLLEATFFHNKLAFVQRTKQDFLQLYEEYTRDIDLFVDDKLVRADDIERVHIRAVDKLYTRERPFYEWMGGSKRKRRFILYIQTSPERIQRDSSYYVFSPFYTGNF